jgi:hypothetical protein
VGTVCYPETSVRNYISQKSADLISFPTEPEITRDVTCFFRKEEIFFFRETNKKGLMLAGSVIAFDPNFSQVKKVI